MLILLANVNAGSRSIYDIARPSVCRLSVCNVRATYSAEIFGNVSSPFVTLATVDIHGKFYGDGLMGSPPSGVQTQDG